jgi:hypothetical protein
MFIDYDHSCSTVCKMVSQKRHSAILGEEEIKGIIEICHHNN